MDDTSNFRRAQLVHELLEYYVTSLTSFSDEQLESLLVVRRMIKHTQGEPRENNPAIMLLNPASSKADAVQAIERLRSWLDKHWEELQRQRTDSAMLTIESPDDSSPDLLN